MPVTPTYPRAPRRDHGPLTDTLERTPRRGSSQVQIVGTELVHPRCYGSGFTSGVLGGEGSASSSAASPSVSTAW